MKNPSSSQLVAPTQIADQAATDFVCLVAGAAGLGDSVVDMLGRDEPSFEDSLVEASKKARMEPYHFLVYIRQRVKAKRFSDVQLKCVGYKFRRLIDPDWKPTELLSFEREFANIVEDFKRKNLVLA